MTQQDAPCLEEIIVARLTRRGVLQGLAAAGVAALGSQVGQAAKRSEPSTLGFDEIEHGVDEQVHVPSGYVAEPVVRWGDQVTAGAPKFDVHHQSSAAQAQQFGYNNDFVAFLPLPYGSKNSDHGLLCVNHEYTNPELMFPGLTRKSKFEKLTCEQIEIEMAAQGHSVVEVRRENGHWQIVNDSRLNRRITANTTEVYISGPAAGHPRLKTSADSTGRRAIGTFANCAGGLTPWGTVLFAEENFQEHFGGDPSHTQERVNHEVYGLGDPEYVWSRFDDRFDVEKEPNEPNRFGWVLEFDPYDPESMPVKRTALGRFCHEGASTTLTPDGHLVVYSGDDKRFEYLYRFVSKNTYDRNDRRANRELLDEGTLSVAQFAKDGKVRWKPLLYGNGRLNERNGFHCQADVLIEARRAARLLKATPMDRPEDVEACPTTGSVFVLLTNNYLREEADQAGANLRADNKHGHIIELKPPQSGGKAEHGADQFAWEIFLLAGNPENPSDDAKYHQQTSANGWLSCPDNCTFDSQGRLWISTDGAPRATPEQMADGVYACDTSGPGRALTRMFFRAPVGAEVCGPAFTPDNTTLFVAVQHPAEGSTFDNPSTRWPDFDEELPPRPSVIAVRCQDGGPVGR